jgi:mannitol/fructose-specific phosphotransferase system IIA component (Ntr-type)
MNLSPFVKPERIILALHADSQRETLQKLIQSLVAADIVTDEEEFLRDIERREAEVTTVMENSIAIPHARSHAVRRLGLAIGITGELGGIRFNPESDAESKLLFCIAIPSFAPTSHIPLLQSIAKFSHDPKRVEKILKSKTPAGAARCLVSFKG